MSNHLSRRGALQSAAAVTAGTFFAAVESNIAEAKESAGLKNNIRHSACKWCYKKVTLEDFCVSAKKIGLESVELLNPEDFPTLKKHGLHCAMVSFPGGKTPAGVKVGGIGKAFNRVEHHDTLVGIYEPLIKASAAAGFTNVICFSGNREGLDDADGIKNCAKGLKRLMPIAEKHKVTLTMELLNSKVNHKDYQCDHTEWGVELCKAIGSEHFKLLYDIYHMQIMEGDVIDTIKRHHKYFSHYHTGGVPGRNEIDESQELYYPAICKAIVATGYKGFIGQEFIPARKDWQASLDQGVKICDV
ncbi:MAG: TIM barrel protein [Verrucomicrobiae bacterium]|nr:TIM barrel protein [Verrucomicrobiae bacterium]